MQHNVHVCFSVYGSTPKHRVKQNPSACYLCEKEKKEAETEKEKKKNPLGSLACFTEEMLTCFLCIVPSATPSGHLLPCGPACVNHRSRAHRKIIKAWCSSTPILRCEIGEGREAEKII